MLAFLRCATGETVEVKLIRDKHTGYPAGYGFVEFESRAVAEKVLDTCNGTPIRKCLIPLWMMCTFPLRSTRQLDDGRSSLPRPCAREGMDVGGAWVVSGRGPVLQAPNDHASTLRLPRCV